LHWNKSQEKKDLNIATEIVPMVLGLLMIFLLDLAK
jgi:hypothetical protein